ncbi:MAG: hypothetical protein GVY13_09170 [Alphaproteobacteria bacterium]|jgi:hypothetical protein|nr:hypothetical protein [Alphaproteobacteria bacterium]
MFVNAKNAYVRATVACCLLLVAWLAPPAARAQQNEPNFCFESGATWLILVDQTEPYTERNRIEFRSAMELVFRQLGVGDRLIVQTIGARPTTSDIEFSRCVPGCPPSDGFTAIFSPCDRSAVDQGFAAFRTRLRDVVEDLGDGQRADETALIATISNLNRAHPGRRFNRIILYSDLLEFDEEGFSFFNEFEPNEVLDEVVASGMLPDLSGALIDVFGTGQRLGALGGDRFRDPIALSTRQRDDIRDFWRRYFRQAGARATRFHEGALPELLNVGQ